MTSVSAGRVSTTVPAPPRSGPAGTASQPAAAGPDRASRKKLTWKEQREFEQLEKDLETLGQEKEALTAQISSGALPYDQLQAASERIGALTAEIDEKELRWLELSEMQG